MDENKLKKLREIGYKIPETCRWCKEISSLDTPWTTCERYAYQHKKHTHKIRRVSIHSSGTCPMWEANLDLIYKTFGHSWLEFVKGDI